MHTAAFVYAGSLISSVTPGSAGDELGSNNQLAYRFESSSSASQLNLGWVSVAIGAIGSGCDVYLTLQGDNGSGPNGTVLAGCYIPALWLQSGLVTTMPTVGYPLPYAMTASTYYNIVFSTVSAAPSLASGFDDVILTKSTATTGAYYFNGASWAPKGAYGYAIELYSTTQTSNISSSQLVNVVEDDGNLLKQYQYSNGVINVINEWVMKTSSAPLNLLCLSDGIYTNSIGTFTGTNCTLSAGGTPFFLNSYQPLEVTVTGTPTSASIRTTVINPTNGIQYIPVNYSSVYSAVVNVAPASTLRKIRVDIAWYTGASTPAYISTTQGPVVTQTAANVYTSAYNMNATSPSTAGIAQLIITILPASGDLASGEIHYVGGNGLFANSNSVWSSPGAGIASTQSEVLYNSAGQPTFIGNEY
jgi:hypothetical protein